jgi:flavin reductase (DIM6/NTAB) family NADH-FMN oxidoreductase RutF
MESQAKKAALRMITNGLYVLAVKHEGRLNATTVSWLSQASFNPPLLMVGLKAGTLTHHMVEGSREFAVNVLETHQTDMAQAFFKHAQQEEDRLSGYAFEPGPATGAPIFDDVPAWLECRVVGMIKSGDHTVVVAEVINAGVRDEYAEPMALHDTPWHYGG